MSAHRISFFFTKPELEDIFNQFELIVPVNYAVFGMYDSSNVLVHDNFKLANVLCSTLPNGNWKRNPRLLIFNKSHNLQFETIPQNNGGVKFSFSHGFDESCILIRLSGESELGVLVSGDLETSYITNESGQSNFKILKKLFLKSKVKTHGFFHLSPKALELYNEGWRLVTDVNSPKESDIRL